MYRQVFTQMPGMIPANSPQVQRRLVMAIIVLWAYTPQ